MRENPPCLTASLDAGVLVEDKLFATLDSTSRAIASWTITPQGSWFYQIPSVLSLILPHHLVASFRATLKEAEEADFLIHVTDISDEHFPSHMKDVETVLKAIHADHIPHVLVFNKIDRVSEDVLKGIRNAYPDAQYISAATGRNVDLFLRNLGETLHPATKITLLIPISEQKQIHDVHNLGKVLETAYEDEAVRVTVEMAREDMHPFEKYQIR